MKTEKKIKIFTIDPDSPCMRNYGEKLKNEIDSRIAKVIFTQSEQSCGT